MNNPNLNQAHFNEFYDYAFLLNFIVKKTRNNESTFCEDTINDIIKRYVNLRKPYVNNPNFIVNLKQYLTKLSSVLPFDTKVYTDLKKEIVLDRLSETEELFKYRYNYTVGLKNEEQKFAVCEITLDEPYLNLEEVDINLALAKMIEPFTLYEKEYSKILDREIIKKIKQLNWQIIEQNALDNYNQEISLINKRLKENANKEQSNKYTKTNITTNSGLTV